jgi:hypothetical protein
MADLSITISNRINVASPSPTNKWGVMVWGTDNWGESKDLDFQIGKWLSETVTLSDAYYFNPGKKISNTLSVASRINFVGLTDSDRYTYILNGVSDPDNRVFPTYTEVGDDSQSYTEVTRSSPTWSTA